MDHTYGIYRTVYATVAYKWVLPNWIGLYLPPLPIFEFFIRFSIGSRWILQIRLFKFWKLEILCLKIWKLQIRRGAALHPTWNNGIIKFTLEDYPGGVHSPHDWLRTRVHKKRRKGCFLDIRRRRRLLQKGYIFRC